MHISAKAILEKSGLSAKLLNNPAVTQELAQELRKRGFRKVQVMQDGKRVQVWTDEPPTIVDVKAVVDAALGAL